MSLFRNVNDGELAKKVERNGRFYAEVERGDAVMLKPWSDVHWVPERDDFPVAKAAVARMAFEADRCLCRILNLWKESRIEWASMRDEDRQDWWRGPPAKPERHYARRKALYDAIVAVFPEAI